MYDFVPTERLLSTKRPPKGLEMRLLGVFLFLHTFILLVHFWCSSTQFFFSLLALPFITCLEHSFHNKIDTPRSSRICQQINFHPLKCSSHFCESWMFIPSSINSIDTGINSGGRGIIKKHPNTSFARL